MHNVRLNVVHPSPIGDISIVADGTGFPATGRQGRVEDQCRLRGSRTGATGGQLRPGPQARGAPSLMSTLEGRDPVPVVADTWRSGSPPTSPPTPHRVRWPHPHAGPCQQGWWESQLVAGSSPVRPTGMGAVLTGVGYNAVRPARVTQLPDRPAPPAPCSTDPGAGTTRDEPSRATGDWSCAAGGDASFGVTDSRQALWRNTRDQTCRVCCCRSSGACPVQSGRDGLSGGRTCPWAPTPVSAAHT